MLRSRKVRRRIKRRRRAHNNDLLKNMGIRFIFIVLIILILIGIYRRNVKIELPYDNIANFYINDEIISHIFSYSNVNNKDMYRYIAEYSIKKEYCAKEYSQTEVNKYLNNSRWRFITKSTKTKIDMVSQIYKNILNDIKCFPIDIVNNNEDEEYEYSDTYGAERTYGGTRKHLGTDVMDKENERSRLKIVSMTDGIVQNIGWNEKGGWRIGIRTEADTYFYYAHLDKYAPNIKKGTTIKSGQLLGYMGDSGYGKQPDTKGKFDVHLHLGIMLDNIEEYNNEELWINPYWILRYAENILK